MNTTDIIEQIRRLERERDEAVREASDWTCCYCNKDFETFPSRATLMAHGATCPSHPMRAVERDRDEAYRQVRVYQDARDTALSSLRDVVRERDELRAEVEDIKLKLFKSEYDRIQRKAFGCETAKPRLSVDDVCRICALGLTGVETTNLLNQAIDGTAAPKVTAEMVKDAANYSWEAAADRINAALAAKAEK